MIELACPKNISAIWRFGSILGLCLVTQIVTGIFLAIYFVADISIAFDSAIYISRDVNNGWLVRSIHANGASIFFICIYIHTGRGLYYGSFRLKEVWIVGVTLFLLTILAAFLGYVLPWGQMSYWAATVITNLLSAVPYLGEQVVTWIWGGYSVRNPTLTRFYAIHYLLPFVIAALSIVHLIFLHETGSRNPLGLDSKNDVIKFTAYFSIKDLVGFLILWAGLGFIVLFMPMLLTDPENFIPANPLVTPVHIQPEWYFLPMYAILRSIPNKLGGVAALIFSIVILYLIPVFGKLYRTNRRINPLKKVLFWYLLRDFALLIWLGRKPVEVPYEIIGLVFTVIYFLFFVILIGLTYRSDDLLNVINKTSNENVLKLLNTIEYHMSHALFLLAFIPLYRAYWVRGGSYSIRSIGAFVILLVFTAFYVFSIVVSRDHNSPLKRFSILITILFIGILMLFRALFPIFIAFILNNKHVLIRCTPNIMGILLPFLIVFRAAIVFGAVRSYKSKDYHLRHVSYLLRVVALHLSYWIRNYRYTVISLLRCVIIVLLALIYITILTEEYNPNSKSQKLGISITIIIVLAIIIFSLRIPYLLRAVLRV